MSSQDRGYEITYVLKGSPSRISEYIYADSQSAALNIVKQKYPASSFSQQPVITGNYKKSQRQLDSEESNRRMGQEQRINEENHRREREDRERRKQEEYNNLTPDERAKREKDQALLGKIMMTGLGLGIALVIISAILYFIYILFLNIISFKTISNYDIGLYVDNIIHFEQPYYQKTTRQLKVKIVNPEKFRNDSAIIGKNKIVLFNGYKNLENNVTARAISYYAGTTNIFAYIQTKNTDVKPLDGLDSNTSHYIKLKIKNLFLSKLNKNVKITKSGDNNLTSQLEDKGYKIIDRLSNGHTDYLYNSKDENTVDKIENIYYGDKQYNKLFMQLGNEYLQSSQKIKN